MTLSLRFKNCSNLPKSIVLIQKTAHWIQGHMAHMAGFPPAIGLKSTRWSRSIDTKTSDCSHLVLWWETSWWVSSWPWTIFIMRWQLQNFTKKIWNAALDFVFGKEFSFCWFGLGSCLTCFGRKPLGLLKKSVNNWRVFQITLMQATTVFNFC